MIILLFALFAMCLIAALVCMFNDWEKAIYYILFAILIKMDIIYMGIIKQIKDNKKEG